MKKILQRTFILLLISIWAGTNILAKDYTYISVPNDPLKARIYTLENGLKVYMTVNKETPRIQTYIAVRVGGKNDPAETTGLAHYFEHLMFKGTTHFGTQNYEQEKPMLDQIEQLFEVYRKTTDSLQRKAIYHQIDSISYEASKIAIPNEYDKLMAAIGARGTNAFTSYDQTVYVEDIPSNQIENWAKIQAERFKNSVIRGFHTELEAVYEEKNMSLTQDFEKIIDNLLASLFPHHPYGTQTVLGTQENLKNPSITNIKNYYKEWYVPNNIAICLSGDFDPDQMIVTLDKYFGDMKPNPNLPKLNVKPEKPITQVISKEVYGPEAECVTLGWRFPGAASEESDILELLDYIMGNGKAGLIDLDLIQQQKILSSQNGAYMLADHSLYLLMGYPKEGQTLEEVKNLLLAEIEKLKSGNFDENLLEATLNNFKLSKIYAMEENSNRAMMFVNAFVNGEKWENEVNWLDRLNRITKKEIIEFANKYFKDNYAVVYKRQGKDPNEKKMTKPEITPIFSNRDTASIFLKEIQKSEVAPIQPEFLDFNKDLQKLTIKNNVPVLYRQNTSNDLFQLLYVFDMGSNNDKAMGLAFSYMEYLGTSRMTPEQFKSELYRLACHFNVYPDDERTYVILTGLNENMPEALKLFEELLADAQINEQAYANLANDVIKQRADNKLNQQVNFYALATYAIYGPKSPFTNILSTEEIKNLNPQELVDRIHQLNSYKHRIMYYGPDTEAKLTATLNEFHKTPANLKDVPPAKEFKELLTPENRVLTAQYDSKQAYINFISNRGEKFDVAVDPILTLYNEYFGGGMNSIVFQEMREVRGLAYSAWAGISTPSKLDKTYNMSAFIASQNDKMIEALHTFKDIINNMPESEPAFKLAKESLLSRLSTLRNVKSSILWAYIYAQDLGLDFDRNKMIYETTKRLTLKDVVDFQKKWVKGRTYTYCILGDEKDLELEKLNEYGPIQKLSQEEIFGY